MPGYLCSPSHLHHPPRLMFRSRRANLVQRLWRLRGVTPGLDDNHGALKPVAHALFKKLKDKELELLLQAVENQGAGESGCVWLEPRGIKLGPSASLLLCRLYRWPDLRQPQELKRLCFCKSEGGAHCCNPHHLSRLAAPGGYGVGEGRWGGGEAGKMQGGVPREGVQGSERGR